MPSLPTASRSLPFFRAATALAVGLSMAAPATALLDGGYPRGTPVAPAASTLVCGALWAWLVLPARAARPTRGVGFAVSAPLAIVNGALASALLFATNQGTTDQLGDVARALVVGALAGMTFGVIYWLPGLVLTLLWFGLPLRAARAWALRGPEDAELGFALVAVAAALPSYATVAMADASSLAALVARAGSGLATMVVAIALARRTRRVPDVAPRPA